MQSFGFEAGEQKPALLQFIPERRYMDEAVQALERPPAVSPHMPKLSIWFDSTAFNAPSFYRLVM